MKHCPLCNNTYTDDTLRFCLQDGTALVSATPSSSTGSSGAPDSLPTLHSNSTPTVQMSSGSEHQSEPTLILPGPSGRGPSDPTLVAPPFAADTVRQRRVSTQSNLDRKPRNLALVVVLTMMATLIVVAFLAGGYWLMWGRESAVADSEPNANRADRTPGAKTTPTPGGKGSPNANASPEPTTTPAQIDEAKIRNEVAAMLEGWVASARARDAAANMSYYADTLNPYYNRSNFPASKVREERARVYSMYQTLDIELSNLKVDPDPSGDTAIAAFDKTWTFERPGKYTSGSVRSQVWLARSGGGWVITGEKDLKVYYLNR